MATNNYMNYQSMVTDVTTGIAQLTEVCKSLSMDEKAQDLANASEKLRNHTFSVGIMGEFRRGKSTVINALLGEKIVPSDIVPCSATLNYVKWDSEKYAVINYKNGDSKRIPVTELDNYITKITKESEAVAETIEDSTVCYPCPFCQNGVQIVDTPGLNDDERMTAISEKIIPTFDAIIMVMTPDSPFSQSEAEFVRNKLMTSDLGKLIFVLNKIDIVDEDEREKLISNIKDRIRESVLAKMEAIYGKDSDEYASAHEKIGTIKLIPVSARNALKGKIKNDASLLAESGYPEFEEYLAKLLTEERGMLQLVTPVKKIGSAAKEALENIKTRREALSINSEEFEKIQKESIEKINETRAAKKNEIESLKSKGKTLYADLFPRVNGVYSTVENKLTTAMENFPITEEDVKNKDSLESLTEKASAELQRVVNDTMTVEIEKLSREISEAICRDVDTLTNFNNQLNANIADIRANISSKSDNKAKFSSVIFDVGGTIATVGLGLGGLPGLGGIIEGYKSAGVKGALVGGLAGYGVGMVAVNVAVSAFAACGLALGFLPLAMIGALAGTFGSKAILGRLFKKNPDSKIAKVRETLTAGISEVIEELRKESTVENWLKETCENAYNAIANDMDKEWEMTLHSMEEQLSDIKVDLEMNEANKQQLCEKLEHSEKEINDILTNIAPVQNKLSAVAE